MSKNRSRRLRKKLHVGEFKELGFTVNWRFPEGTDVEALDKAIDRLIEEVIEPNGLAFEGSGYLAWEGLVCMQKLGSCTEEHRELVKAWLNKNQMQDVNTSELLDIWWN